MNFRIDKCMNNEAKFVYSNNDLSKSFAVMRRLALQID